MTGEGDRASGGRTLTAVFDGANQSEGVLSALKAAGFRAEQVRAAVHDPAAEGGAGAAGGATIAAVLGAVLGALLGGILGRVLLDGTLPILLGALAGAVAGAAIAITVARTIGARQPVADATGMRPGSVTLTLTADDADQEREARAIFERQGGRIRPGGAR